MISATILGSGSCGNCTVVSNGDSAILLDAGISCKQMEIRLKEAGFAPADISGILITHEHGDHVKGLETWCKKHQTPIYGNIGAIGEIVTKQDIEGKLIHCFETGRPFSVGGFSVMSMRVPHEAREPVGYIVKHEDLRLAYLTDLGHVSDELITRISLVNGLIIEANYDREMFLREAKDRPWATNNRNGGRAGHLSNDEAAVAIHKLVLSNEALQCVALCHLSANFNTQQLALDTIKPHTGSLDLFCAEREVVSRSMDVL